MVIKFLLIFILHFYIVHLNMHSGIYPKNCLASKFYKKHRIFLDLYRLASHNFKWYRWPRRKFFFIFFFKPGIVIGLLVFTIIIYIFFPQQVHLTNTLPYTCWDYFILTYMPYIMSGQCLRCLRLSLDAVERKSHLMWWWPSYWLFVQLFCYLTL